MSEPSQAKLAGLREVYERYGHMDKLFTDSEHYGMTPESRTIMDLWAAVKAAVEGETK